MVFDCQKQRIGFYSMMLFFLFFRVSDIDQIIISKWLAAFCLPITNPHNILLVKSMRWKCEIGLLEQCFENDSGIVSCNKVLPFDQYYPEHILFNVKDKLISIIWTKSYMMFL